MSDGISNTKEFSAYFKRKMEMFPQINIKRRILLNISKITFPHRNNHCHLASHRLYRAFLFIKANDRNMLSEIILL